MLVLLRDSQLLISDGLVTFFLLRQQILMFLLNQRVVFLLTRIDFSVAQNFISGVFLLDWLDLSLVHMIKHCHLLLLKVNRHFCYLLLGRHQLVSLPLLGHLEDFDLANVVVIVEVIFCCVNTVRFILMETNCPADHLVVSVLIDLGGLFPDILYSFDEPVMISVGIVSDDPHSPINLNQLLPMR